MKLVNVFSLAIVIFTTGVTAGQASASEKRFYLVGEKITLLLKENKISAPALAVKDGQTVIQLSLDEMEKVGEQVHSKFESCGGFIDVQEEVVSAGSPEKYLKNHAERVASFATQPFDVSEIRFAEKSKQVMAQIKEARFQTSLGQLTQFPDRSARTENGKRAAEWLRDEVQRFAQAMSRSDVSVEMVSTGSRFLQDSVVVKLKGQSTAPGVLVGGHMDTFNWDKPGADDDGTGTISVLEIFRSVLESDIKFDRDMYFVFYAAEEMGLVGSSQVARKFRSEGIQLRAVLQFDMTGYRSSRETNEMYFIDDNVDLSATAFAEKVASQLIGIPTEKIRRTSCGYSCSDHASWDRNGYAAVFPFESSFSNHNRSIHSSSDTVSILSIPHAMKFVRLGAAFMSELGEPLSE